MIYADLWRGTHTSGDKNGENLRKGLTYVAMKDASYASGRKPEWAKLALEIELLQWRG
jgi:hypothetical protein